MNAGGVVFLLASELCPETLLPHICLELTIWQLEIRDPPTRTRGIIRVERIALDYRVKRYRGWQWFPLLLLLLPPPPHHN